MRIVEFTPTARHDLEAIEDWIARDSPDRAVRFLEGLADALDRLATMPLMMGLSRPEIRPGLRSLVHGRYVVFYRPTRDGITVLRVLHGHRDLSRGLPRG